MTLPIAQDVRDFLEGYEITTEEVSDNWINTRLTRMIMPKVAEIIERPVEGDTIIEEYLNGTGTSVIFLGKKNITELVSISYVSSITNIPIDISTITVMKKEGMIKASANYLEGSYSSTFKKGRSNIKVVYKVGENVINPKVFEAILCFCADLVLVHLGTRTGGGSISVQGYSRNFGSTGKYHDLRIVIRKIGSSLLNEFVTGVV